VTPAAAPLLVPVALDWVEPSNRPLAQEVAVYCRDFVEWAGAPDRVNHADVVDHFAGRGVSPATLRRWARKLLGEPTLAPRLFGPSLSGPGHHPEPAREAGSTPIASNLDTAPKEGTMQPNTDSLPLFNVPAVMAAPAAMPFVFEGAEVRVAMRDGAPWFVLADVCAVLGIANNRNTAARLDDDEKGVHTVDTPGGPQEMAIINESGLYSTILTSRKEAARRFKRWVTGDVLPSIRKHGGYIAGQEKVATGEMDRAELMARGLEAAHSFLREAEEARRVALARAAVLEGAVAEKDRVIVKQAETIVAQEPAVAAIGRLRTAEGDLCLTDAAKALKLGRDAFIDMMAAEGWIYRRERTKGEKRRNNPGAWVGSARMVKAGMVDHRPVEATRNGVPRKIKLQVTVKPKGLIAWAEKLGVEVPA
jgi:prophage antirepressor-like protein